MKLELNKIYNMDCVEGMKQIPNEYIDLIVTDPPYPTTKRGISKNTTTGGMMVSELGKQGKMFQHNNISPKEYIPEFYRVLKDNSQFYIMTNHVNLQEMLNVCTENGFHFIKSLIWKKDNKIMGQWYMSQFEYILFFRKGKAKRINNCGTADVLEIPNKKLKGEDGKNLHDTEKPVELMKILIENSSKKNDIVLEPFAGCGSTLLACKETGRNFIGFELDKHYHSIAEKRLLNYQEQLKIVGD